MAVYSFTPFTKLENIKVSLVGNSTIEDFFSPKASIGILDFFISSLKASSSYFPGLFEKTLLEYLQIFRQTQTNLSLYFDDVTTFTQILAVQLFGTKFETYEGNERKMRYLNGRLVSNFSETGET